MSLAPPGLPTAAASAAPSLSQDLSPAAGEWERESLSTHLSADCNNQNSEEGRKDNVVITNTTDTPESAKIEFSV